MTQSIQDTELSNFLEMNIQIDSIIETHNDQYDHLLISCLKQFLIINNHKVIAF